MAISSFRQIRFWRAYCKFLFASCNENEGLLQLGDALIEKLPGDRPLKVLCLGVGVGAFEYPILSAIRSRGARAVEVYGLDLAAETLPIAGAVFQNLDCARFKSSNEFAEFVAENWTANAKMHPNMRCVDMDGRRSVGDSKCLPNLNNVHPWELDFPSLWHNEIKDIIPEGGFDIITASNCLSHMHWWRPALCNALQMLREGGLLLYSRVDGDVNYLDWNNSPDAWLTKERENSNAGTLVRDMMRRFYALDILQSELLVKASSRAIKPWEMMDLIERLPLKDLEFHRQFEYYTRNSITPQDIHDIMDTCGISPFRRAKDVLGKDYEIQAGKILSEFASRGADVTRHRIRWHCYQVPSQEKLNQSALVRRFATSVQQTPRAVIVDDSVVADYELLEASIVAHNSFKTPKVRAEHFVDFVRDLILSGTLRHSTSFGVVGQRLVRQEALRSAICFLNPLHPSHPLTDLISNVCLRQLRNYSNAGVLLKEVLPSFNIPVVFSYVKRECDDSLEASINMEFQRYRSFAEICFVITVPRNFQKSVTESQAFKNVRSIIDATIAPYFKEQEDHRTLKQGCRHRASFVLEVPSIPEEQRDAFALAAGDVAKSFETFGFSVAFKALTHSWQNSEFFRSNSEREWSKVFSEDMAESLYWLCLIPDWQKSVIYPATYADPKSQGVRADDFFILFYDQLLTEGELRHEYRKVTLMFDRLNMRRLATSSEATGVEEALAAFSHELSKQTTALFSKRFRKMSALFEVNDLPRTNDTGDWNDWPTAAGKVDVAPDLRDEVGDWLVCPVPKLLAPLKDYLMLWAGSPGSLRALIPILSTLNDLIQAAVQVAQGGTIAKEMNVNPKSISAIHEVEREAETRKNELPAIVIQGDDVALDTTQLDSPDGEVAVDLLFRAMVATISNALQHTQRGVGSIEISTTRQHDGVVFAVRNPVQQQSVGLPNMDGSAGVIRSCLQRLDKDTTDPNCGKDSGRPGFWLTSFLLPFKVKYRNSELEWLKQD